MVSVCWLILGVSYGWKDIREVRISADFFLISADFLSYGAMAPSTTVR
jgi:hypothetical protein